MPFLPPNQQRQSTEGESTYIYLTHYILDTTSCILGWCVHVISRLHHNTSPNTTGILRRQVTKFHKSTLNKLSKRKKNWYAGVPFLPARRYASACTTCGPVSVCLCVRLYLSQVGVLSIDLVLAWRLLSANPTLCCAEIQVFTKIIVLPSGTFSWTPDLENFATAYRSSKRAINLARERWTLRAW